jgi:hypothetical protein
LRQAWQGTRGGIKSHRNHWFPSRRGVQVHKDSPLVD